MNKTEFIEQRHVFGDDFDVIDGIIKKNVRFGDES